MRAKKGDWDKCYSFTRSSPPSETLLKALQLFESGGLSPGNLAVDLGCGAGRDTIELLRRQWQVLAIDANPEAIRIVRERVRAAGVGRIRTAVTRLESAEIPSCALVNAAYSLPFCPQAAFPKVWKRITEALREGGRFAGQLLGVHDEWANDRQMNFHAKNEVLFFLKQLDVEYFKEVDKAGRTSSGTPKHWHVFHLVARTPNSRQLQRHSHGNGSSRTMSRT